MKKATLLLKGIASLMTISLLSITFFATNADSNVWENIESSYYISSNEKTSTLNIVDDELLLGSEFIPDTIAPTLSCINLNSHEGIENFIQNIHENGLKDSLLDNKTFLGVVEGVADPIPGTAFIKNGVVNQVIIEDKGELYLFNLSPAEKEFLSSSELDLNQTIAYFVFFDGFATGIVFDDGSNQMVKVYSSYQDIIPSNTILSLNKFLDILKNSEEILTEGTEENQNLDPIKPNVTVG